MTTSNPQLHREHQARLRERRRAGAQRVQAPWHWLTIADVRRFAAEAYRVAAYDTRHIEDGEPCTPEHFASQLQEAFSTFVAALAQQKGVPCAPANAEHYAACMRRDVPESWQPQYPLFALPEPEGQVQP